MTFRASILFVMTFFISSVVMSENKLTFQLEEATINSIHSAIKNKNLSCEQLINLYLNRIKKYNLSSQQNAPINAFTELNTSVLEEARSLDNYYNTSNRFKGTLHCIPVVLKDNIDTFDTNTTVGSFALLGNHPKKDARLVAKLRSAGAIILGKTGMDEFAWGMFGTSSRTGRIGNAYNAAENPGGSSGGSAAAVSANFSVIGIGTDNSGSVRIPAAFNGIVGLRPSMGLISQTGIFPMGNLDGTAGPMARTAEDLAIVLTVIAETDNLKQFNLSSLDANSFKGKRIGIIHKVGNRNTYSNVPESVSGVLNEALLKMKSLGATTVDIDLPLFENGRDDNQAGEIEDVNNYLNSFAATRQNFKDICESNRTRTFGKSEKCIEFMKSVAKKNSAAYKKVLAMFEKNKKYVDDVMDKKQLDALLLLISTTGSATYDGYQVNTWQAPIASNSGLPSITFNVGYDKKNMPIGIELIGRKFSEALLTSFAYAYEKNSNARMKPTMPIENTKLINISIPEFNNLINQIGKRTYNEIINDTKASNWSSVITPNIFQKIVDQETDNYLSGLIRI